MTPFKPHHIAAAAVAALAGLSLPAAAVDFFWTSGAFSPGGTAPSPLSAGDSLLISGAASKSFSGVAFTNDGQVIVQAGTSGVFFSSAASVVNNGLWDMQDDADLAYTGGGSTSFTNHGTLRKSGGTGITSLGGSGLGFTNDGTLDAQTGTLRLSGGPMLINAGSVFTGAGVVEINANATFNGAFMSDNLRIAGGTQTGNAAVVNGQVDWTAGSLDGTWTVGSGQTLVLSGAAAKSISGNGSLLTNQGTVAVQAGTNGLFFTSSASVVNQGLWDMQDDADLAYTGGGSTSFTNHGTLRKSGGTGITSLGGSGMGFTNDGTLDAQTGTLRLSGGPMLINAGSVFTGAGVVEINANATFNGAFTSENLRIAGGTQTGNAAVVNGQVDWTAGSLDGTWTVGAGQTLALSGAAAKAITGNGTVLTNDGTVAMQAGTSGIFLSSAAGVVNNGLWDMQDDASLAYTGGGSTSFTNHGTLRKSGGTGITSLGGSGLGFTNDGTLDAQTGTLRLSGGPMAINAGSVFTGAGVVEINTNASFNGAFTSGNLRIAGGTQTGNAAVVNGQVGWVAGSLDGTWTVASGQTLTVSGAASKSVTGAGTVLTSDGAVTVQAGTSGVFFSSGGSVVNNGRWDMQDDADLVYIGGAVTSFVNQGLLVKSGGTGDTRVNDAGLGFSNPGTVDVQTGTIVLPANFVNTGTLTGDGRFSTLGALSNEGTVAAGSTGLGTLTMLGNFAQTAAGTLAVDLLSLGNVDLLDVTGAASLDGTLALSCFGACSFAVGDSFTILDAATSLSGSFAGLTLSGFATGAFDVIYDAPSASVRLLVTQSVSAVPEPGTYALWLAGLAAMVYRVRRSRTA